MFYKLSIVICITLVSCTNNNNSTNDSQQKIEQREEKASIKSLKIKKDKQYDWSEGLVPDKKTASKIAEIILLNIYGDDIREEMPFIVTLVDNEVWFVKGTGDLNYKGFGCVVYMSICKKDGRILRVGHGK